MHRTPICLEQSQYERLAQEARSRGISLSTLIRRLVDEHFAHQPASEDPLDKLMGVAEGSGDAISRHHNRYLYGKDNLK